MKRILYSGSVHDQAEKDAVMEVLDGGVASFVIGRRVAEMERHVADLFAKSSGIMVNSGSSALYLAVELLDLPAGSEVITSPLTFSTDIAPLVRAGLVPVLVDVEADTYNADVSKIEEMISPRTRAILLPNLIGNAPDWDEVRAIADRHDLQVVEDSCDALGATCGALRPAPGPISASPASPLPTSSPAPATAAWCSWTTRSCATGRSCCGGGAGARRCSCTGPAGASATSGKRSTAFATTTCSSSTSSAGTSSRPSWEPPSGWSSSRSCRRTTPAGNATSPCTPSFSAHADRFMLPRQLEGLDTAWLCYPITVRPGAGFTRSDLQRYLDDHDVDTRTIWTGNAVRQPMMKGVNFRAPAGGMPNADLVMEGGIILPCSHAVGDEGVEYVCEQIDRFLARRG